MHCNQLCLMKHETENYHQSFGRAKNFPTLSSKEKRQLQERLLNKPYGFVFVHPFYLGFPSLILEQDKKITLMQTAIKRLLQKRSEQTPPLFIFEEEQKLLACRQFLNHPRTNIRQDCYLIPTQPHSPEPTIDWPPLLDLLEEVGMKKVIIGGMYLKIIRAHEPGGSLYHQQRQQKGALNLNYTLNRCCGKAALWLATRFEVDFCALTYPQTRKDIEKVENESLTVVAPFGFRIKF